MEFFFPSPHEAFHKKYQTRTNQTCFVSHSQLCQTKKVKNFQLLSFLKATQPANQTIKIETCVCNTKLKNVCCQG